MKSGRIPPRPEMSGLAWSAQPWLGGETLSVLAELNEQCLSLLIEQAAVRESQRVQPLLRDLAGCGRSLTPPRSSARRPVLIS